MGGVGSTLLHVVYAWYNLAKIEFESYKIVLMVEGDICYLDESDIQRFRGGIFTPV